MQPLKKSLRNLLEKTIRDARDIAEDAGRAVLTQLGVGESTPYSHLNEDERKLRRQLRAHGRQLGDHRDPEKKTQEIERLVEEVAYEHWHRMLFARFLAENDLLMYPDPDDPVPITLDECEDLAVEEGAKNGWELAARFATQMLPQIFRSTSPVFQLELPPEHQQKLERLLAELPSELFIASDSLGWVYQFWQTKKKNDVNKSEIKIGARELPAVTQLFTEPYMVSFLLDNSLGAWWAARRLTPEDLKNAVSEEELRQKAAIHGVPLKYLRFVHSKDGTWIPASGTFDEWPNDLRKLKILDPSSGSGHFLVATLLMLVPMHMELEKLTAEEAIDIVLRENLHGLEIDQRVVEIAALALALTAWRYPNEMGHPIGYRKLPELHLACSGLSITAQKEEWLSLAGENSELQQALETLYQQFKEASLLGSLINLETSLHKGSLFELKWKEIAPLLLKALGDELDDEKNEMGVIAHGLAKAANLLANKYHLIITNVPYLARGKQNQILRQFCEKNYKEAKNDLATVFLDRCLELAQTSPSTQIGGTVSVVLPQNWLFLTSYKKFREKLLKNDFWRLIARLGPQAFQTPMWDFNVQLLIISRGATFYPSSKSHSQNSKDNHRICGLDVSALRSVSEKANQLITAEIKQVEQIKQLENPDARVALEEKANFLLLKNYAVGLVGIQTGDDPRYLMQFWEVIWKNKFWELMQATPDDYVEFTGLSWILCWKNGQGELQQAKGARIQGTEAVGKIGVAMHRMRILFPYHYAKTYFHQNIATIIPHNPEHLPAIWCFCSSPKYNEAVRRIDQKLNVTNATLVKVPFDLEYWTKVAAERYPNGLPKPYSDDPTQWIFHGHPCGSVIWNEEEKRTVEGGVRSDATVLQVAVARLLGYRWPAELDGTMELADEQRAWVKRSEELLSFGDEEGIVCLPSVAGKLPADERLLNLLVAAYGEFWSNDRLNELLELVDHGGKTLEGWLRDKFFIQHCKLFHHRPFIWHIWDGLRDGFAVLVNYHKFDRKKLETLIYTYLGEWINRQKLDIDNGIDGAEEKLDAANNLKKKLELILEGESPYDIFVRWKPIERQPIGWEPDLNDGVRLNIRPFMTVGDVKKKGAGILRDKPNIHWKKDRGKDVESAPWYHLGPEYGYSKGTRINNHHLTLEEKRRAREKAVHK